MGREVAESCVEGVMTEMVSAYCSRFYANKPELAARRLESIGFQVGLQLSERHFMFWIPFEKHGVQTFDIDRYTMERPRFGDHLEVIKFICKDFWNELFKKQIDNLKTNHKGTFVLQDNRFRWLTRVSVDASSLNANLSQSDSAAHMVDANAVQSANMHLYFPCGVIRGALTNLGVPCAVSADISNLPACSFVVRIKV